MIDIDELLRQAIHSHQQGRLTDAEPLYRQILSQEPNQPDALHLLGVLALQCGDGQSASELIVQAIHVRPDQAIYYSNLALALEKIGCRADAVRSLRRAIQLAPAYAEAHNNLGKLLREENQLDEAETCVQTALRLQKDYVDAWINLGVIQLDRFSWDGAERSFNEALRLAPDASLALSNLAIALMEQGKEQEALSMLQRQVEAEPDSPLAFHGLGTVYLKLRRLEEAVQAFQNALTLDPLRATSWTHLGCALHESEKFDGAVDAFRQSVALDSAQPEANYNLGRTLSRLERYDEAIQAIEQAIALRPRYAEALSLLVNQLQHICLWDRAEPLAEELVAIVRSYATNPTLASWNLVNPSAFTVLPIPTSNQLLLHCARRWAKAKLPSFTTPALRQPSSEDSTAARLANRSKRDRRIRIGYLSADFRQHVMATHLVELFECHDRNDFEVFGYSVGLNDQSPIRERIRHGMDHWIDAFSMTNDELVSRITRDQIDVLIDLQGYSDGARLDVLSRKPAPIQVTYLGFPCTLGCDFIDYMLVDAFVAPRSAQPYFTEKLVQLPGCYQANPRNFEVSSTRPDRSACGLPENAVVYSAFNNFFKITSSMFDAWMKILQAVDGSVLWLPSHIPMAVENLRREARRRGVDGTRLIFANHRPLPEHIARLPLADIFLDTFPYSAHGTAALSLRAGVPIVTLIEDTMASRVAGSLLHTLQLDELIASSLEEYLQIAMRLGVDRAACSNLRSRLAHATRTSDLFDSQAFARKAEAAYRAMHLRAQQGLPPLGFQLDDFGKAHLFHD